VHLVGFVIRIYHDARSPERQIPLIRVMFNNLISLSCNFLGRDSSVSIPTRYGLDGPGIESRWGARYSAPVQAGPAAHPASYTIGTGSFPGVKLSGRGVHHPPPSSAEVKEIVELYLYSPSGPSWPVLG